MIINLNILGIILMLSLMGIALFNACYNSGYDSGYNDGKCEGIHGTGSKSENGVCFLPIK